MLQTVFELIQVTIFLAFILSLLGLFLWRAFTVFRDGARARRLAREQSAAEPAIASASPSDRSKR